MEEDLKEHERWLEKLDYIEYSFLLYIYICIIGFVVDFCSLLMSMDTPF